jgi:hypothetical protein
MSAEDEQEGGGDEMHYGIGRNGHHLYPDLTFLSDKAMRAISSIRSLLYSST